MAQCPLIWGEPASKLLLSGGGSSALPRKFPLESSDYFRDAELTGNQKLQLFWGRGDSDPVITAEKIEFTQQWVEKYTQVEQELYPGLAHGIAAQELTHISDYLSEKVLG